MTQYNLKGSVNFKHDEDYVAGALGIPGRWGPMLDVARQAWKHGQTFSEKIEYLVSKLNGAELVLALIFFGDIWDPTEKQG